MVTFSQCRRKAKWRHSFSIRVVPLQLSIDPGQSSQMNVMGGMVACGCTHSLALSSRIQSFSGSADFANALEDSPMRGTCILQESEFCASGLTNVFVIAVSK